MSNRKSPPFLRPVLPGTTFERWTVIEYAGKKANGKQWLCRCSCGTSRVIPAGNLRQGLSKSCGCYKTDSLRGLPYKFPKEHQVWEAMKARCRNPRNRQYKDYGGRGVKVCARWLKHSKGFFNFMADMGARPSAKHQLDRFPNNDGPYSPNNCRWATPQDSNRHGRKNHFIAFQGKVLCLAAWSEISGIPAVSLGQRLSLGWTPKQAITTPLTKNSHRPRSANGTFTNLH